MAKGSDYTLGGFVGPDSFTFRGIDTAGASDTGTVRIEVLPLPALPDPSVGANGITLNVGVLPAGVGYTVVYKNGLDDSEWLPVPPTAQWPSTAPTFAESILVPERFYRIKFEFLPP